MRNMQVQFKYWKNNKAVLQSTSVFESAKEQGERAPPTFKPILFLSS
jgi:hypothetical protein